MRTLLFIIQLLVICLLAGHRLHAQAIIKLYPYRMEPSRHPDAVRYYTKSPGISLFDNRMQFISLRDLSAVNYKETINKWVYKDRLGNILWPAYPLIYQQNLPEVVAEIKKQGLYLFDLWGYVPGSGPGGTWQQYTIPKGVLNLFESQLGDHWLGMDIGEQDGRYVGSFAPYVQRPGEDHLQQYFNFQRHFQKMGDELGNKLAALVSLNFGHYFLKEGIYTLIGAETAQGLPNTQVYYSFIRGAGKQYGVSWFGNASVWNRWGYKTYGYEATSIEEDYNSGGPLKGTSLSLLKRLMYHHIFYNCIAAGFEGSMYQTDTTVSTVNTRLSPIGRIQQEAVKWSEKNGDPGIMYTPVALMTDFFAGWSFPRHLYTEDAYKTWGNLPYHGGDYLMDNVLDILYPRYQDASYYRDERGFITPTPYGDMADCLLSDAPLWVLKQYPVLVIAGELQPGKEINDKLESYVKDGGHLVITAGSLKNLPDGIAGIRATGKTFPGAGTVSYNGQTLQETSPYSLAGLSYPSEGVVIQQSGNTPAAIQVRRGKGQLTVLASAFGIAETAQSPLPVKVHEEKPLDRPFPILNHVKALLQDIFASVQLFETNPALSIVTCIKSTDEYNVLISNDQWTPQDFTIHAKHGEIVSVKELPVNNAEMKATGYTPKVVITRPGSNTAQTIAGGSVRIFRVKLKNTGAVIQPEITPTANSSRIALGLGNIPDIKEAVLARPTFFAHYDRVMIDWRYLHNREKTILQQEAGWISRQKLGITVDLSSGINLYADLRIVNNDSVVYEKSMQTIKEIIDKMLLVHADKLVMDIHQMVENNFTPEQFEASLVMTLQELSDYAANKSISIVVRTSASQRARSIEEIAGIVHKVNRSNCTIAGSMALILREEENADENISLFKKMGVKEWLMAAPERDIHGQWWNTNALLNSYSNNALIEKVIRSFPGAFYTMDAFYRNTDDEYLDVKLISAAASSLEQ